MTSNRSRKGRGNHFPGLALTALTLLCAPKTNAQVVSFDFTGVTTILTEDPGGHLAGMGIGIGTPYTGQISYDAAQAGPDIVGITDLNGYQFPAGVFTMSLNIAGHTFLSDPANAQHQITVDDRNIGADSLTYGFDSVLRAGGSFPGSPTFVFSQLELNDSTRTALSSALLPTTMPDLSKFLNLRQFTVRALEADANTLVWNLGGNVTSITPVPEPATAGLAIAASLSGFAIWRRMRSNENRYK